MTAEGYFLRWMYLAKEIFLVQQSITALGLSMWYKTIHKVTYLDTFYQVFEHCLIGVLLR